MNIYTFWIDLDVICSNLQEFGLVSRGSESIVQKYGSKPKGAWPVKIRFFARNHRNRSKLIERRPGPTQIDPGGRDGTGNFEICSYYVEV